MRIQWVRPVAIGASVSAPGRGDKPHHRPDERAFIIRKSLDDNAARVAVLDFLWPVGKHKQVSRSRSKGKYSVIP